MNDNFDPEAARCDVHIGAAFRTRCDDCEAAIEEAVAAWRESAALAAAYRDAGNAIALAVLSFGEADFDARLHRRLEEFPIDLTGKLEVMCQVAAALAGPIRKVTATRPVLGQFIRDELTAS